MRRHVGLAVAIALLLGGTTAACTTNTDDLETQVADLTSQLSALNETVQHTQVLAALDTLDTAGLHDIDEGTNELNEIPGGAAGGVDRALLAVASTEWPDELSAQADEMQSVLERLAEALATEDIATIAPIATEAHDTQHDFSTEARNLLKESAGLPVEEHEEGGEATPTAVPTP